MRPIAVDAFSGAGGLSLGLSQAGWRVAVAFDSDPIAVATYRRNLGPHAHVLDADHVTAAGLMKLGGFREGECGLLAGGPPCQGFSLQRRGERNDSRNDLVLRFLDLVTAIQPRAFLMENVPAIATRRGRDLLDVLVAKTADLGYRVYEGTLDAADYGLAQRRRRTFVVGLEAAAGAFSWPRPVDERLVVRDVIGDLPSPPSDGSPHPDFSNHYREARLSALNIARIKHVPQGGGREYLPRELQLKCHANGHRHLDTYGRLAWDKPSGTITARFDSFTRGRFAHPDEHRSVTLREGARLQGFPDSFVFLGNREEGARMIGNAVPPPLAATVGRALFDALYGVQQGDQHGSGSKSAEPATVQVPLGL